MEKIIHTVLHVGLEKPVKILHVTDVHLTHSAERDPETQRTLLADRTWTFRREGKYPTYTPDEYLGNAYDFEGTYQTYFSDSAAGLYIAKEDPNVLMVELKQGEYVNYVILMREK